MTRHVVLGAGPVARAIVDALRHRGIDVDVVSRSGTEIPGARAVTASVLETERLSTIVNGAAAVYQASQPEYHRWPQEFPALQDSVVRAIRNTDAVLVAVENLYGYGAVKGPISE
jgi:nucleoside-diphosphate-sugar epimerase